MTGTSLVALLCTLCAIVAPILAGHIPATTTQAIITYGGYVVVVISHFVAAMQPNSAGVVMQAKVEHAYAKAVMPELRALLGSFIGGAE